ncbi:MAG TPA: sugar ABC transporter substrate-binding protein, partial [Burkholderiaceae bacterium]|nr:sugar ABC transporter substrate-binding protein [Burkholderiaceae bacterium]
MQSLKATPAPVDEPWSGPTSGPRAAAGKVVAVLAEDLRNGGVLGVAMGMREAAGEIGWRLKIFNAGGTRSGRVSAWRDGMASGADALAVCGSDAEEFEAFYRREAQPRTMIIGWHVAAAPGPLPGMAIRLNVTTDPQAVARVAAAAVLPAPGRRTGVVIFNDSRFSIANTKVAAMREVV